MLENKKTELLRAENLNKIFPGVHAVNDVSMTVYNNEVLGICGENGAGKSTLLKILGGIYKPESGRIFFAERKSTSIRRRKALEMVSVLSIRN